MVGQTQGLALPGLAAGAALARMSGSGATCFALYSDSGERDAAAAAVKSAGAVVIGEGAPRLPNTLFLAVEGWDSPQQLITLDLTGVMVSAGSACSSGKVKPSKTISAMGLNTLATGGVRVSGGWSTVEGDWIRFADAWSSAYIKHRTRQAERVKELA